MTSNLPPDPKARSKPLTHGQVSLLQTLYGHTGSELVTDFKLSERKDLPGPHGKSKLARPIREFNSWEGFEVNDVTSDGGCVNYPLETLRLPTYMEPKLHLLWAQSSNPRVDIGPVRSLPVFAISLSSKNTLSQGYANAILAPRPVLVKITIKNDNLLRFSKR